MPPVTRPEPVLSRDLSDEFLIGLAQWGRDHKTDPRDMLAVSAYEAGVHPQATNPKGAWGLFQWTEASRAKIGWLQPMNIIATLPSEAQLPLIDRYFRQDAPYRSIGEVYGEVFLPGRMRDRGRDPSTVLTIKGEAFYDQNTTLDANKDGRITIQDLETTALGAVKAMGKRWTEIMQRLAWAESTLGNPPETPGIVGWPIVAIGVGVGVVFALANLKRI